jgi:hypothetical protein
MFRGAIIIGIAIGCLLFLGDVVRSIVRWTADHFTKAGRRERGWDTPLRQRIAWDWAILLTSLPR